MFKESAWRLFTQFIITILAVLTSVLVNRLLGPTNKGMFTIVSLAVGMMNTFGNFGISQAVTFHTAKKTFTLSQMWTFIFVFSMIWGLVVGLVGLVIVYMLPADVLKLDRLGNIFLIIGALALFSQFLGMFLRSFLLGNESYKLFNQSDILRNLLSFLGSLILLLLIPDKLLALFLIWLVIPLINMGYLLVLTRQPWDLKHLPLVSMLKVMIQYGIKTYVANLLQFLNYRLDQFILNFFMGVTQVGLYSVAVGLGEYIWQLSNAVQTILFPKVASTTTVKATLITARANRNTLMISFLAALGLGSLSYWIILILYGQDYLPASKGLIWLLPGIVAFSVVKILYSDLAGRGYPEVGSYITGGAIAATVVGDFLLIPTKGLVGAAQASSVAYIISAIIAIVIYKRMTHIDLSSLLLPQREDLVAYRKYATSIYTNSVRFFRRTKSSEDNVT